jgi:hypothetical protein
MPDLWVYDVAPRFREVDTSMYQTLADLRSCFEFAGWQYAGLEQVRYEVAPTRTAYLERLRLRAMSTFEHMDPTDIDDVFRRLEAAVSQDPNRPVEENGTLLAWHA